MSKKETEQDESRRALVTNLLGLAGAGALISAASGCNVPGPTQRRERAGSSGGAISMETCETIADLATFDPGDPYNEPPPWILVLGYLFVGDGGGGLFYWDDSFTGAAVPGMRVYTSSSATGAFIRVYEGALNVRWFGAIPNYYNHDCSPGIEAAIQFSLETSPGGGGGTNTVYFPMGEYVITETIVIPRLALGSSAPNTGPITLRGEGREKSAIVVHASVLAADEPIMGFDATENHSHYFTLEGLSLKREDPGIVFDFRPTTGWGGSIITNRLTFATFRDVLFFSTSASNAWGSEPCVYIEGGQSVRFESVNCRGGSVALHLNASSFCTIVDCVLSPQDGSSANGLFITGGGSHMIQRLTIGDVGSDTNHGTGILIDDTTLDGAPPITQLITFQAVNGEGGNTSPFFHVASGCNITVIDMHAPNTFTTSNHNGTKLVHLGEGARHVRFIGGSLENNYTSVTTSSRALVIDDGAKDIIFDDVRVGDADFDQNLSIDAGAKRVELNLVHGTVGGTQDLWSKDRRTYGMDDPPTLSTATYQPSVLGSNVWNVASSHNIGNLLGGYAGQIVTLLIPPGSQIVSGYGFQLAGNSSFSPTHYSTMQFVFDGSVWRELSRCESGTT